ncbi:CoA transferase [SAR202 cluster bacterium AC-409-J13_OGT_754m]|nr:CoA transferase [SAR202 cluster bacterium AC-409-J13_OGT_754m]
MNGPQHALKGIRVLDLGRYQAGPRAALILSRMGAEVIKIEKPGGDESRDHGPFVRGQSAYWVQYNSGKLSLGLNLRTEAGKAVLSDLVKVSDIFIQNFRPGTIGQMGFSYERLRELNRRIIMVNVSAFGQNGPYSDRIGFDPIGQAISGMMLLSGSPGDPPTRTYNPIIDRITALHATIGALSALHERESSGEGQTIDVCLADSGYSMTEIQCSAYLGEEINTEREGNGRGTTNVYQTNDGWILLSAQSDHIWPRFCNVIGKPEWSDNDMFINRAARDKNYLAIEQFLTEWFKVQTTQTVVESISQLGIPIHSVNDIPTAAVDSHLHDRKLLVEVPDPVAGKIHVSGDIIKLGRSGSKIGPTPTPGEHTEQILGNILGYDQMKLRSLSEEGAIYFS